MTDRDRRHQVHALVRAVRGTPDAAEAIVVSTVIFAALLVAALLGWGLGEVLS